MTTQSSPIPSASRTNGPGSIGIAGAGLMGRLLALLLSEQGWQVTLFDRDNIQGIQSCGHTGAGMLAPISELESAEPLIAQLGLESLSLWKNLLKKFKLPVFFQQEGTLIVAHPLDAPDLNHFRRMLQGKLAHSDLPICSQGDTIQWELNRRTLQALEPQLGERFSIGIHLPIEGQIDNRQLLPALAQALARQGVNWYTNRLIQRLSPHQIEDGEHVWPFDWVIDCRGLGAKPDWRKLRGVRGEIIRVHAPEVSLNRPIRLMHPRHPLYIAPRENHHYLIGATSIESEDFRAMTVQSAMELLSAAFTVHPGFAEASILETAVNCRPALPDNLPRIQAEEGLIRVNGLYRHGFLIAPKLAELVCGFISSSQITAAAEKSAQIQAIFESTRTEEATAYAVAR